MTMGKSLVIGWGIVLLLLPVVMAVGYAPVTIVGTIVDGGVSVDASVSLKSFVNGEEFGQSSDVQTVDGMFAASVSVPSPSFADVQVLIVVGDELFVEVVEDVRSWGHYALVFDIADDSLGVSAPRPINTVPVVDEFVWHDDDRICVGRLVG